MSFSNLLAATDDGIGKFVVAVIFVVFWVISAVASAINKKTEEAKRRRAMDQISPEPTRRQRIEPSLAEAIRQKLPPVDVRPQQRSSNAASQKAQAAAQKRKLSQKRPAPPPLPKIEPAILIEPQPVQTLVAPAASVDASRKAIGVGAPAIRRWLTPATLRQQFILTELLQPPKALRPDEQSW